MKLWKRYTTGPSDDDIERATKFWTDVTWARCRPVRICDERDALQWRCIPRPARSPYATFNLVRKPDFEIHPVDGQETAIIRRTRRFPATFELEVDGKVVGEIQLRSVLRSKYRFLFNSGRRWTMRMPLFTTVFWGESNDCLRIWVALGSVHQWYCLLEPSEDDRNMMFAIAFIHREWCVYS